MTLAFVGNQAQTRTQRRQKGSSSPSFSPFIHQQIDHKQQRLHRRVESGIGINKKSLKHMRSFIAEVACYLLTCLVVILCRTATTSIISGRSGSLVDAYPIHLSSPTPQQHIQHQQRRRRDLAINAALTSTGPALPSATSTSTTTLTQRPLIQIIAPNVTLFAALDLPPSSPSPSSPPSSPPAGVDDPGSTPLLLPTASLTLEPSQIYHVNDTLIFGAGGSEPLTVMAMTMSMIMNRMHIDVYRCVFVLFCFGRGSCCDYCFWLFTIKGGMR